MELSSKTISKLPNWKLHHIDLRVTSGVVFRWFRDPFFLRDNQMGSIAAISLKLCTSLLKTIRYGRRKVTWTLMHASLLFCAHKSDCCTWKFWLEKVQHRNVVSQSDLTMENYYSNFCVRLKVMTKPSQTQNKYLLKLHWPEMLTTMVTASTA